MKYLNVSGYRFVPLDNLSELQVHMLAALREAEVLGTILIAEEGINVALSATAESIEKAKQWFDTDERFAGLWLKESWSEIQSPRRESWRACVCVYLLWRLYLVAYLRRESERHVCAWP